MIIKHIEIMGGIYNQHSASFFQEILAIKALDRVMLLNNLLQRALVNFIFWLLQSEKEFEDFFPGVYKTSLLEEDHFN